MFVWRNQLRTLFKQLRRTGSRSSIRADKYVHTSRVFCCKDEKKPKEEEEVTASAASKYEVFVDYKSPIIFDIEQEREKFYEVTDGSDPAEKRVKDFAGISQTRGETGVFDIHELVSILNKENAIDMVVIKIPEEYAYVDYFVIITGRSWKHMSAMAGYVRRVWKYKTNSQDYIPIIEGENSKDWKALDLGNIALHIMSKSARELYDLESLWSVGPKYDKKFKIEDEAGDYSYASILSKLMPATEVP